MCSSAVVELTTLGGLVGLADPWLVGIQALTIAVAASSWQVCVSLSALDCMAQGLIILVMPQTTRSLGT